MKYRELKDRVAALEERAAALVHQRNALNERLEITRQLLGLPTLGGQHGVPKQMAFRQKVDEMDLHISRMSMADYTARADHDTSKRIAQFLLDEGVITRVEGTAMEPEGRYRTLTYKLAVVVP